MTFCKICKKNFKVITPLHLKKHNTNLKEYIKSYGNLETQTNTGKTHFGEGHIPWNKGQPNSNEVRLKISEALKGRPSWNKGKKLSPGTPKANLTPCLASAFAKIFPP